MLQSPLLTSDLNGSYEAVHPVRSLSELKHRLGRGRRCFAFFHPCLPEEPLVFVHVALLPEVAGSMEDVRRSSDGGGSGSGSSSSVGDNESEGGCKEEEVSDEAVSLFFFF